MNILHVVCSMDPKSGGVSQAVRTIITGLKDKGLTSEVVCIETSERGKDDHFPVYFMGRGKTSWRFHSGLKTWLVQHMPRYDAVIVHGLWQYHTLAVSQSLKALKGKIPKVYVMPHGMLDPWFQYARGREIKSVRNWLLYKLAERNIINDTDGLLFTSETERRLAQNTFAPYAPKSESVVSLGVVAPPDYCGQMKTDFQKLCDVKPDRGYLLYLSRITPKKGVSILIEGYLSLKSAGYALPQLVIAGPGLDTDYGRQMQQLAARDNDIFFPGMLTGNAKWGAFYGCEAFILPSHQENFGIAVVEALACSRPVLISDQVNIWREINEYHAGIMATDTLAGVKSLLKNWLGLTHVKKMDMSVHAREAYLQNYSIGKTSAVLSQVLSGQKPHMQSSLSGESN